MTLPKAISDAIDAYGSKSVDHGIHDHYGTDRATFDAKRQVLDWIDEEREREAKR